MKWTCGELHEKYHVAEWKNTQNVLTVTEHDGFVVSSCCVMDHGYRYYVSQLFPQPSHSASEVVPSHVCPEA